jgi:hypothetical protein
VCDKLFLLIYIGVLDQKSLETIDLEDHIPNFKHHENLKSHNELSYSLEIFIIKYSLCFYPVLAFWLSCFKTR